MRARNQSAHSCPRRAAIRLAGAALIAGTSACGVDVPDYGAEATQQTSELRSATQALTSAPASEPTGGKYKALQDALNRQSATSSLAASAAAPGGPSDTLAEYSAKCDIATGVSVPSFSCENGTEVPGQEGTNGKCDKPNVLNNECDPGSKFQVLVRTADQVVVAHCRKDGQPKTGTLYNDVAVIQYNKRSGAQCFYQALINLQGASVPAPGSAAGPGFWKSPHDTESIRCTGCHDNGGLIRSPYLAQLTTGKDAFPNASTGFDNQSVAVKYVGRDFALNKSWTITGPTVVGSGAPCNSCHRLAVSNYLGFGRVNGTAGHFATQATNSTQANRDPGLPDDPTAPTAKNPHGPASPIWMRPGQVYFDANAYESARKFENCATGYWAGQAEGFTVGSPTAGCTFTPLATSWDGLDPAQVVAVLR